MNVKQTRKCLRCGGLQFYRIDHEVTGVIRRRCPDCEHVTRQQPIADDRDGIIIDS